uniref:Uncharacterized protein TCIL3000_10_7230 n=1 Tax=Trypanosoma congolense (strain IL3000) TaxID=1068625 RepID=G0UX33_TRYCI|nr:unnamed protein product [Trypanosoma congolense IL3000]
MEEDSGDWGLLSIADMLDTCVHRKSDVPASPVTLLTELEVPLLSCEPPYAISYVQTLIKNSKNITDQHTSTLEELDAARCMRLRRSLAASALIRGKMLGAIESFALTARREIHNPRFLQSIVSLGPIACPNIGLFFDSLIESMESMAFMMDYTQDDISVCVDVIQSFKASVDLTALEKEQYRRLSYAEFSLALRCEKLSAVVKCLLCMSANESAEVDYRPPPLQHSVTYMRVEADGFLPRMCDFSCPVYDVPVYCFPSRERLFVCSKSSAWVFDQLGLMGTRFRLRQRFDVSVKKGGQIIYCDGTKLFAVHRIHSAAGVLHYTIERWDHGKGKPSEVSEVVFSFDNNIPAVRDVLFRICGGALTCLVCSKATRLSNSKCYVFSSDVNAILSKDHNKVHLSSQHTLKRGPYSWPLRRKCYYFTKTNLITVGRVTLKEKFHPFTIEMWVYPCSCSDSQTILSIGDKNTDEILIEIEPTSGGVTWRGGSRTPHLGVSFVSYHVPDKVAFCYRWWHVGLLFKGNSWEMWVNDAIVASAPALVWPKAISDAECALGKSFIGFLAEVRIWNCYRTSPQLYRDSRRCVKSEEPTLIGYYPLDEGEGDVIADHSPSGCHAILHHGQAGWSNVDGLPIATPQSMRYIDDFAPIAWRESSSNVYFSTSPGCVALAVAADGPCIIVCEYALHNLTLVFQVRIDLSGRVALKGLAYCSSRHSLTCYASSTDHPRRLLVWELHKQPHLFLKVAYRGIWDCERDLLTQCSAYAEQFVGVERCLVDQLPWFARVPKLVLDASDGLLENLLKFIQMVLADQEDDEHVRRLCSLLHANLVFRIESNPETLEGEIGGPFPDAQSLIAAARGCGDPPDARTALLRLSFRQPFFDTGLLSTACRCLLSDTSRFAFIKGQAGRTRITEKEDALFRSLLEHYESLHASSLLMASAENAQHFCISLMDEEIFQVEQWISGRDRALDPVKSASRCLEVFQEILLAKAVEVPQGECGECVASYAKLLLGTREKKKGNLSLGAFRSNPVFYGSEIFVSMEQSIVGAILLSFSIAFWLFPTSAKLVVCFM